jgi:hypothetical protein
MLYAHPSIKFFSDARPELMAKQARCPAAAALLATIEEVGVLRAVWPSTEPIIAETWAASFGSAGGLYLTPVEFIPRVMTSAPLFAATTARVVHMTQSFASNTGRTVMTTLSARLGAIATNVVTVQGVAWLARFAAVVEIMRLSTSASERLAIAKSAWQSLAGDVPRDLERATSSAHMRDLRDMLPASLRNTVPARSSRIPIWALLLEVGNPKTASTHTVLRGLRYAFNKASDIAQAVSIREKVGWRADHAEEWLASRLAVVREFWAVQYAALGQVVHVARHLRSDLRWWVEVSAAVNLFRAGVMRGYDLASRGGTAIAYAGPVGIRCRPYHAAAHLRKALAPYFATPLPQFHSGDRIEHWAYTLTTVTAPHVKKEYKNIPRAARAHATADHTSHFTRGAALLAAEGELSQWMTATTALVAKDCEALLERRSSVMETTTSTAQAQQDPAVALALMAAGDAIVLSMEAIRVAPPPTELFSQIEDDVTEDAWDDFVEAAYDSQHPAHKAAVAQMAAAKSCRDPAAATAIARWVQMTFRDDTAESLARIT